MLGFSSKPYKLGIVLSGGGARGLAHCGALQAFEEMGLRPDIMAGVSAGSVVTAMYAAGLKPQDILKIFTDAKFGDFAELAVPRDGFFSMGGVPSRTKTSPTSLFRPWSAPQTSTTTSPWPSLKET